MPPPSLGISRELHDAIKETYNTINPTFPVPSLSTLVAFDKEPPRGLGYFACIYVTLPSRQKTLVYKGPHAIDPDTSLHELLNLLRADLAAAVRPEIASRNPGLREALWRLCYNKHHDLTAEVTLRMVNDLRLFEVEGEGDGGEGALRVVPRGEIGEEEPPAYGDGGR